MPMVIPQVVVLILMIGGGFVGGRLILAHEREKGQQLTQRYQKLYRDTQRRLRAIKPRPPKKRKKRRKPRLTT